MLQLLSIKKNNAVGVKLSGKVGYRDIDPVLREIEKKLENESQLGIYVELDHFEGFSQAGILKEVEGLATHLSCFTRTAMVGEDRWYNRGSDLIKRLFPNIELEHFSQIQRDEALLWVSEREADVH